MKGRSTAPGRSLKKSAPHPTLRGYPATPQKGENQLNTSIKNTLKYVTKTVWKNKPQLYFIYLGYFLLMFVEMGINILLPKFIIDEIVLIVQGADVSLHLRNAVCFIALSLGANFLYELIRRVLGHYVTYLNEFFNAYVNLEIERKSMSMDFEYTEDPEVLNQLNRAKDGISWYSGGIIGVWDQFYRLVSGILACCTVSVLVLWKCPVLIPVLVVCILFTTLNNKKINKIEAKFFAKLSKVNRLFGYYFWEMSDPSYGKDIRLYNATDLMIEKADSFNREMCFTFRDQSHEQKKWFYLNALVDLIHNIICNVYVGWKAITKSISIGDISMLTSAFGSLYANVWKIVNACLEISKRCNYFNEFIKFRDYPEVKSKGEKQVHIYGGVKHTIEFKNVYFKYPRSEKYVLENVNIKINSGEHLSVVGLNGAGKTTFIKLLCRLYDVSSGEILIDGINIKEYDEEEYKKLFSVVFQDFKIMAFSLKENICLAQSSRKIPLEGKELDEKISGILKQTGLYDYVETLPDKTDTPLSKQYSENGTEFSGGQNQKTAISRALFRNSPVVILDEPTAALDPIAEYEIYRQFNDLVGGKTAVYISHRLSSCKFCDKIAVFSEGTIKEYGSHSELVKKSGGLYAKMFFEQAKYYA